MGPQAAKPIRRGGEVALLLAALCACQDAVVAAAPRPRPALHFFRDLPIEHMGGDDAALHTDPGGGLWVGVPGESNAQGRSRLFHRPPGGAWRTVYEGPFATELSLSSFREGEVYFGFNQPLSGSRPTLLRVTDAGAVPMPAPDERLDELEFVQVGSYAMLGERVGWACGARGRLWRFDGAIWTPQAPVLPWQPTDRANFRYGLSLRFDSAEQGWLGTMGGDESARWDGRAWTPLAMGTGARGLLPATGLIQRGDHLERWRDGAWQPLAGPGPLHGQVVADERGRLATTLADGVLHLGEASWERLAGPQPFEARGLAEADGALWVLGRDALWRATSGAEPTFAEAAPGAAPRGLRFVTPVDLDGDGDLDLLGLEATGEAAYDVGELVALLNDGTGRFTRAPGALARPVRQWVSQYAVGDLDGDGDADLAVLTATGRAEVWTNYGGQLERTWSFDGGGGYVALVDVDGDGALDLDLGAGGLFHNDGAGRFTRGPAAPTPPGTERLLWEDVDGDGLPDAVATRWRDPAHLLHNLGGGAFRDEALPVVAEGAAFADLDLDGRPELYAQRLHNRERALPAARCTFAPALACAPEAAPAGLYADLDLDGRPDVIGADLRGGERSTGAGTVFLARDGGYAEVTAQAGALAQAALFDADGDGDPDAYLPTGLLLNTADAPTWLTVRPRASGSDRLAQGARVLLRRAGSSEVVATGAPIAGQVTLGLPDPAGRYDVEVRFPDGAVRTAPGVGAGSAVTIHDRPPATYAARAALLWARNALRLASPLREGLGLALALAALLTLRLRVEWLRAQLRPALLAFGAVALGLLGVLVRARGALPWLLGPVALGAALASALLLAERAARLARRFAGPYLLLERLGAGAAATVYRARLGTQEVALKLFDAESMRASDARDRFFREARTGAEVVHPNLVRILEAGQLDDGRGYLAMQLVSGRSLDKDLAQRGRLPVEEARRIAADVATALGALHAAGIVHRDVKPENVMLRDDGRAVLTDLGLVRSVLFKTVTRHDVAVGTLAYMSPEQCVGRPVDGRSDVWSLGVLLYEMLAGQRPFQASHELELVYRIHNVAPAPLGELAPGLPAGLVAVVARCLAKEPEARYADAQAVVAALSDLGGVDEQARGR